MSIESINGRLHTGAVENQNRQTDQRATDQTASLAYKGTNESANKSLEVKDQNGEQERQTSPEDIHRAVDDLNQGTRIANKQLHFTVHEGTDRLMVQVVDSKTQKVIKEIPPEKVLDAAARIKEFIGVLLDQRV